MKNKILNPTLITFLPALVFIPLIYQLILYFHLGGLNLFSDFIISAFNPKFNYETILIIIIRLNQTIVIALSGWIISSIFGIFFGVVSSNIFYKLINIPILFKNLIRVFLTIIRSIHEVIWCLILLQINGINMLMGIIAICIPFSAINAKVIREQIDNINLKDIESIVQINGDKFSSLMTLIWNPVIQNFKNYGIYRLECSIRSSAILGIFGVGGIGTSIFLSFQSLNFRELWTYLWSFAFLIIIFKKLFDKSKFNNIDSKFSILIIIFSIIVFFYSTFYFLIFILNINKDNLFSFNEILSLNLDFYLTDFIISIFETISLTLLATGITISLPPILLIIFNNKRIILFIRILAFWLRTIPPPIIILVLLMFNEPSLSLAALTLGIHNASITFKLLNENLYQTEIKEYHSIKSSGASNKVSWLYGLFLKQVKSYLSYCVYRSDILIRETAIVGIIGSIGLGWKLRESLSSFAWNQVSIILITYSSIAIIGEMINDKIKSNLI